MTVPRRVREGPEFGAKGSPRIFSPRLTPPTRRMIPEWVPVDHLLRRIDAVLDLSGLRHQLAPFYSHTGRPSVDPELMIRILLVGYCYGIRSERRLCEETHLNLAYRWFCRLGLEGAVPDHSTFSKNRHGRFRESALLRRLFENVVVRCMQAGLVGGEGFAIDASVIEADASRGRKVDGKKAWPETEKMTRAVREYLAALDEAAAKAAETKDVDNDLPPGALTPFWARSWLYANLGFTLSERGAGQRHRALQ